MKVNENWPPCDKVPLSHSLETIGETPAVAVCGTLSLLTQVTVVPTAIVRSSSAKFRISEVMVIGSGSGVWVDSAGAGVCVAVNAVGEGGTGVGVGGIVTVTVAVAAIGAGVGVPVELSSDTTVIVAVINGCMVQK